MFLPHMKGYVHRKSPRSTIACYCGLIWVCSCLQITFLWPNQATAVQVFVSERKKSMLIASFGRFVA